MEELVLFPYGGNAREAEVLNDALNGCGVGYKLRGYLDDNYAQLLITGTPLLGVGASWGKLAEKARLLAVPGNATTYLDRKSLIDSFDLHEGNSLTLIDPSTRMSRLAKIGFNSLVLAFGYIGAKVEIGRHCVLLFHVGISHDAKIGDYTMICPQVAIGSHAKVGNNCYLGQGANIREGVIIGDGALVAMGANVLQDVPPRAVVAGNPARILRIQQ